VALGALLEPVKEVIYFKRLVYTRALVELAPIAFPQGQPRSPVVGAVTAAIKPAGSGPD